MFSFFTKTLKIGICTAGLVALAGAGAFAVVGKERTHAVAREVHSHILEAVDKNIDDPAALRTQLREMEQEYPKRIAQVQGDLAELRSEMRSLERERAISERVVALAEQDLARLEGQMAAQLQDDTTAGAGHVVPVRAVAIGGQVYSPARARARVKQVQNTRIAYANRSADAEHDLLYLEKQAGRLEELLAKLEGERAEFQSQIMRLSRDIDSIARNDRLIKLIEKRNRTIDECSRYESVSLEQITGRLADIKSRQEAELDFLANAQEEADYEDLARMQLATEELEARNGPYEGVVLQHSDL